MVTFAEVHGMPKLNAHAPIRVKNCKVRVQTQTACMGSQEGAQGLSTFLG